MAMILNNFLFAKYRPMNEVLQRFLEKDILRKIKNIDVAIQDYLYRFFFLINCSWKKNKNI